MMNTREESTSKTSAISAVLRNKAAGELMKRGDPDPRACTARDLARWAEVQCTKICKSMSMEMKFAATLCEQDWVNSLTLASTGGQPVYSAATAMCVHSALKLNRVRSISWAPVLFHAKRGTASIDTHDGERFLCAKGLEPIAVNTLLKAILYARRDVGAEDRKWSRFRKFNDSGSKQRTVPESLQRVQKHVAYINLIAGDWARKHPDRERSEVPGTLLHVSLEDHGSMEAAGVWYELAEACRDAYADLSIATTSIASAGPLPNEKRLDLSKRWGTSALVCFQNVQREINRLTGVARILPNTATTEKLRRVMAFGAHAARTDMTKLAGRFGELLTTLTTLSTAWEKSQKEKPETLWLTTKQVRLASNKAITAKMLQNAAERGRIRKKPATKGKRNAKWELESLKERWQVHAAAFDTEAGLK